MIATIAESINIMSKTIGPAMKEKNAKPIQDMAIAEAQAGATFLDVNIGPARKGGAEMMEWLVTSIHEVVDLPLSLDTTNLEAMEAGLKAHKGRPLINSIPAIRMPLPCLTAILLTLLLRRSITPMMVFRK